VPLLVPPLQLLLPPFPQPASLAGEREGGSRGGVVAREGWVSVIYK